MNKKSIGALLLSAALLVGGTASTFAYFTNSATSAVAQFTTGNVKVAFSNDLETPWELCSTNPGPNNNEINLSDTHNAKKVAPGDTLKKTFVLKNVGSLDAKVRFSLSEVTPTLTTGKEGTFGGWCSDWKSWKAYTIKDGEKKLIDLQINYPIDGATLDASGWNLKWKDGYAILDASATSDQTIYVEAYVTVNPLMENGSLVEKGEGKVKDYANFDRTFSFQVNAEATQWNNPGWKENGTN